MGLEKQPGCQGSCHVISTFPVTFFPPFFCRYFWYQKMVGTSFTRNSEGLHFFFFLGLSSLFFLCPYLSDFSDAYGRESADLVE